MDLDKTVAEKKAEKFSIGGLYRRNQYGAMQYSVLGRASLRGNGLLTGTIEPEGLSEESVQQGSLGNWELVAELVSVDLLARLEQGLVELEALQARVDQLESTVTRLRGLGPVGSGVEDLSLRKK